jgi:oxygen-dependent protoporphyrinogen oxidase
MSPLLSWPGKLRAGLDLVLPRRATDAAEESLGQFVRRRFGRELFERIAQPMVSGIYTADPERLSVAAAMPQFIEWEREHRSLILAARARTRDQAASGPRYGLFVSLRDGLHRCVERLRERLTGVDLRLNTPIRSLARTGDGWRVTSDTGTLAGDRLAIAGPANLAATLVREADAPLADELVVIPYAGAAILNLSFTADQLPNLPVAAGFVVPAIEKRTVLAATFMSVKYAGRAPTGTHLLRVFLGGAGNEALLDQSDGELVRRACGDLRELLGLRGEPVFTQVDRWPRSMAQFHLGHRARVARIRARESALPHFALLGNGYEGVGIPDVIAQANTIAARWAPT